MRIIGWFLSPIVDKSHWEPKRSQLKKSLVHFSSSHYEPLFAARARVSEQPTAKKGGPSNMCITKERERDPDVMIGQTSFEKKQLLKIKTKKKFLAWGLGDYQLSNYSKS